MEVKNRKDTIKDALIESFINDHKAYKNTISLINKDLLNANINFQYTYDEFCVDFLNESLMGVENNDIFMYDNFNEFYSKFFEFNLMILQNKISKKLNKLGYNFDDVYKK